MWENFLSVDWYSAITVYVLICIMLKVGRLVEVACHVNQRLARFEKHFLPKDNDDSLF
jgi:hypothetical protein